MLESLKTRYNEDEDSEKSEVKTEPEHSFFNVLDPYKFE